MDTIEINITEVVEQVEINVSDPAFPGGGGGTTVHNETTGRDAANAHPIGAITGLQGALDGKAAIVHGHVIGDVAGLSSALSGLEAGAQINAATAATITDAGKLGFLDAISSAFRSITWANLKLLLNQLYTAILIAFDTTIVASGNVLSSHAYKFTRVDSLTDVTLTITVGVFSVGTIATYQQVGSGIITFSVANGSLQAIAAKNKSSATADVVQLIRLPDIAGIEQYKVIGGVA